MNWSRIRLTANGKCESPRELRRGHAGSGRPGQGSSKLRLPYRKISAELAVQGHVTRAGKPRVASIVQKMLGK
jgi:hypothetical protein